MSADAAGRALVTGGSRGIGAAIVQIFAEHGYDVDAPTRSEMDLSDGESVRRFIEKADRDDRGYDVIVNDAGINIVRDVGELDEDALRDMLEVNLISPFRLLNGLIPRMKKKKHGRIVNIGSIWGVVAKPGRSVYSATKHGVHGLTMTLAVELAPFGILVNTVAPGQTMTELTRKNNDDAAIAKMREDIPLGRLAEPAEIARAVYWLGSDENTYVTGQCLVVDGGLTIA